METANIVMDFVLFACAIWMVLTVRKSGLGGVMGGAMSAISFGAIVLGLAHIAETVTFEVIKLEDIVLGELIHRGIVFLGFVLLVVGFSGLSKLRQD